jgi:hypothetical protein
MKVQIELIYDADCPNVPAAREAIQAACRQAGMSGQWQEWDRASADVPDYVAHYGSPTVLVDGVDVAGGDSESDARACRVYRTHEGEFTGVPPAETIAALLSGQRKP